MPDIALSLKVAVADGPTWSIGHRLSVEAYDVIDLVIPPGTVDQLVELQPSAAARINLVAIQSSLYGAQISFKTSGPGGDSSPVALLGPQLYGDGVATLFSVPPLSLKLSNQHPVAVPPAAPKNARIQILVGRNATP